MMMMIIIINFIIYHLCFFSPSFLLLEIHDPIFFCIFFNMGWFQRGGGKGHHKKPGFLPLSPVRKQPRYFELFDSTAPGMPGQQCRGHRVGCPDWSDSLGFVRVNPTLGTNITYPQHLTGKPENHRLDSNIPWVGDMLIHLLYFLAPFWIDGVLSFLFFCFLSFQVEMLQQEDVFF